MWFISWITVCRNASPSELRAPFLPGMQTSVSTHTAGVDSGVNPAQLLLDLLNGSASINCFPILHRFFGLGCHRGAKPVQLSCGLFSVSEIISSFLYSLLLHFVFTSNSLSIYLLISQVTWGSCSLVWMCGPGDSGVIPHSKASMALAC